MLTTSRKKAVGDSSGKMMVQKRRVGPGAVDGGGLDHRFRDRLQPGQEEQEIVADLLPGGGQHHQRHGVVAVEQRVPVDAERAQAARHQAERGLEHEEPQHAGNGGRHRVGPDQQRLVDAGALDALVGLHREQQRDRQRERADGDGEDARRRPWRGSSRLARTGRGSSRTRRSRCAGRRRPAAGTTATPPGSPASRRRRA